MKTTILNMRHTSGKILTLIGMSHIGSEGFYRSVMAEINKNEQDHGMNGIVLFESVKGASKDASVDLRAAYKFVADLLGLVPQHEGIKHNGSWVNCDITYQELVFCDNKKLAKLSKINQEIPDLSDLSEFELSVIRTITRIGAGLVLSYANHIEDQNNALIGLRNNKAVLDIIRYFQTYESVTVTYGEAHLKGIIKQLKPLGFKVVQKRKLKPF